MNLIFISDEVLGSRAPGLKSGYNTQVCKGFLQSLKQLGKANNQFFSVVRMSILSKGNYQLVKTKIWLFPTNFPDHRKPFPILTFEKQIFLAVFGSFNIYLT